MKDSRSKQRERGVEGQKKKKEKKRKKKKKKSLG
jgi:hypothetical protein